MHILIITQYFWPENFKINDLAKELIKEGYKVTVLTGLPNYPGGRIYKGYKWLKPIKQSYENIHIIRVPLIPRFSGRGWQLIFNYISFALTSSIYIRFFLKGNFDKIFVYEISPITIGYPAIVARKKFNIPIIFWVLDLWPESVFALTSLKSKIVQKCLNKMVEYIYSKCDRILVSSNAFVKSITSKKVPQEKIIYFPNWAEDVFINEEKNLTNIPSLPQGFNILFAGNIGEAQDFDTLIKAADILRNNANIHWIIVGDGRKRESVIQRVAELKLAATVHWLGKFPIDYMPEFFKKADALLVLLKDTSIFELTVPAKIQTYLASKKPIIGVISGEGKRIILNAKAGFVSKPGDAEALALNVIKISIMNKKEREELAHSGYLYYIKNFEKNQLIKKLVNILDETKSLEPLQGK